ncbi:hypothetical protein BsWGS_19460 [Bradybaena similaris]
MYIRYTTETILTSLILVSRVWSRPLEGQCEGQRREGDKWFDGCRWCVCQQSGPLCSSSDCSVITSQLPACHNTGSSWRDGCYFCQCHLDSIECSLDQACLVLLHSNRPEVDTMSNGACVQPTDERCVCGVDGVPSCTAEVIDKNAVPAITVDLNPTLSSSPSLRSQVPVYSNPGFMSTNTRTREHSPDITGEHYGEHEELLVDSNKGVPDHIYNSGRNTDISNRVSLSQNGGHSVQLQGLLDRGGKQTVPEDEAASLLVITANRCRWGVRWYGGGLRCYCGTDNSITCGDPNFVASRIDGFRLQTGECDEGRTWEVKDACTVCTCQISGVTLCHRSPTCRLPFLIKALLTNTDAARNFEIGTHNQILNAEKELTEQKEHTFVWNKAADKTVEEPSSSTEKNLLILDYINKEIDHSEVHNKHITSGDHPGLKTGSSLPYYVDVDGSGDTNFPEQTTTWPEDGDVQTHDTRIKGATIEHAILEAEKRNAETATTPDNAKYEAATVAAMDSNATVAPGNSNATVAAKNSNATVAASNSNGKCIPGTHWLERRCSICSCNSQRVVRCNDSLCPRRFTASTPKPTLTSSAPNPPTRGSGRPVQSPPRHAFWDRTGPITIAPAAVQNCGRFRPGDIYWENCNMCECATDGPKCTMKSCS